MKKILVLSLIALLAFTGCSGGSNNSTSDKKNIEVSADQSSSNEIEEINKESETQQEDRPTNVKIISTKISIPIGDRTADNVSDENGDFFAIGSDIVKCSDYDNVHVIAELTNNRDILYETSALAWSAKMDDGYELGIFQDGSSVGLMNKGDLDKQIQGGSSVTVEFDILKEKSLNGDKVILTYWDVDHGEQFDKFMGSAMSGESEEKIKKEFPQYFDESLYYTFEIPFN